MFLRRNQDSTVTTQYITELKSISKKCDNISHTAILRDIIISGMKDEMLRNKLLIQINKRYES